jgi:hypothetical protein
MPGVRELSFRAPKPKFKSKGIGVCVGPLSL